MGMGFGFMETILPNEITKSKYKKQMKNSSYN